MATEEMEVECESGPEWKSPVRKLARFFRRSRDRWKAKYFARREQCKLMGNQARAVEKSRAQWREAAKQGAGAGPPVTAGTGAVQKIPHLSPWPRPLPVVWSLCLTRRPNSRRPSTNASRTILTAWG